MDLYEVYIDHTKTIIQQVLVDVEGVSSQETVALDVPDPIIVGYYVVDSLQTLTHDIFKDYPDFKFTKLDVAYGDISQLRSAVSDIHVMDLIATLKQNLDKITFQNVLNFVFGKPLIEPPVTPVVVTTTDTQTGSVTSTPAIVVTPTPDITNALKEQLEVTVPKLQELIQQKEIELSQQPAIANTIANTSSTIETVVVTPADTGFATFVEGTVTQTKIVDTSTGTEIITTLPEAVVQQLQQKIEEQKQTVDSVYQGQIAFINFRSILLPLLYDELQRLATRDIELSTIITAPTQTTNVMVETTITTVPEITVTKVISTDLGTEPVKETISSDGVVAVEKTLADGTVVTQVKTPTKIYTTSDSTGTTTIPTQDLVSVPVTTSYVTAEPQKESVNQLFLGTEVATTTETKFAPQPSLVPPDALVKEESVINSGGTKTNFGSSIITL